MENPKLLNHYICTLISDKDIKHIHVAAPSFGKAASLCYRSILGWDNRDSYELTKIVLSDLIFI